MAIKKNDETMRCRKCGCDIPDMPVLLDNRKGVLAITCRQCLQDKINGTVQWAISHPGEKWRITL